MFKHMHDKDHDRGHENGEGHCGHGRHRRHREEFIAMLAAKGGPFGRGFMGGSRGGRGFGDDGDGPRGGRFLGQGDIRTLVLMLIEDEPRHGYEIIKQIEELSAEAYAPSPGVIYPTLTFLEEAGYAAITESEGSKKRYAITEEGRAYLEENRALATMLFERLKAIGEKASRMRKWRDEMRGGPDLPKSVEAAMMNLREVVARKLEKDPAAATDIVRKLLEMADGVE
ncbi:helix-turn-helix transcriptional regulator [Rhizobium sp. PAMB 3182]